ncbi:hypothetical protein C1646_696203 [Rhizophagus diaphanus]|nr:hypothetical protein C1646_696203 [Rhizophagus diaphanus] [Rhizophagus sp. MUCL 43196]
MDGDTSNIKSLKFQMIIKLCLGCKFKSNFFNLKWFNLHTSHQSNYNKSPSGNNEIDNRLKYYYSKVDYQKNLLNGYLIKNSKKLHIMYSIKKLIVLCGQKVVLYL